MRDDCEEEAAQKTCTLCSGERVESAIKCRGYLNPEERDSR